LGCELYIRCALSIDKYCNYSDADFKHDDKIKVCITFVTCDSDVNKTIEENSGFFNSKCLWRRERDSSGNTIKPTHAVTALNKSVSLVASVCRYAVSVDTVRSANWYSQTPNAVRLVIAARELQYSGAFSDTNEKHIKDYYGSKLDLRLQARQQHTQETRVST
jgi:hypothetical protein